MTSATTTREQNGRDFRNLLMASVARLNAQNVPLFLSGGVDSASVLFAQLELGGRPPCFTFKLEGPDSSDALVATKLAAHFGLYHEIVELPRDWHLALRDTIETLRAIGTAQKTHVQCTIPMAYVAQTIAWKGYERGLMGMAIGDAWATSRHPQMLYHAEGEAASKIDRRRHVEDPALSDYSIVRGVKIQTGLELVDATRDDGFLDFMLHRSMVELHTPKQKQIALDAFPEYWKRGRWYRTNSSMQLNSGLRDFYDTLLDSPVINASGHKSIVGLYNQLLRELNAGAS